MTSYKFGQYLRHKERGPSHSAAVGVSQIDLRTSLVMIMSSGRRLGTSNLTPYPGMAERQHNGLMEAVAELFYGRFFRCMQDDWFIVVWNLAFRLCVNPQHVTSVPDFFHQFLKIPPTAQ